MLAEARQQLRAGMKRKDIARSLGVKIATLSGWLRDQTLDQLYPSLEPSMNPRARSSGGGDP